VPSSRLTPEESARLEFLAGEPRGATGHLLVIGAAG
jgi:hypothetical protein